MAEVVRQAVDAAVPDEDAEMLRRWERALSIVGAFDSGGANIAERHDDYLGDEW
jgi:uncharacterized protein YmfQ (DUF2313 family)